LKRILLILSFIALISVSALAQSSRSSADPGNPLLRFYPNPATSFVTFDFQKNYERGFALQVYNFLGKVVYENKNMAEKTTINLSDYNRGIYIYQLRDASGRMIESGKFQVAK